MKQTSGAASAGLSSEIMMRASRVKVLLMDVDGVLTDGTISFAFDSGCAIETKGFNSQDGLGLTWLSSCGIKTGVISGRNSQAVVERAAQLKMSFVFQGVLENKIDVYRRIRKEEGLADEELSFIGDDFTDVPLMRQVGLAAAVANARREVQSCAHLVTQASGGGGAVREVAEVILKAQGFWDEILSRYAVR